MAEDFPFCEDSRDNVRVRTFSPEVDTSDLVWHRDYDDRVVTVVESDGWYFQRDGELPVEMRPGDVIPIEAREWHRVIRRKPTRLVVEIRPR